MLRPCEDCGVPTPLERCLRCARAHELHVTEGGGETRKEASATPRLASLGDGGTRLDRIASLLSEALYG